MYWLDGSSSLPFVLGCSYMLSSSRARKIFLAQDLIENQARIVKSCVKTDNFDHWCYAASELVDLMIDLARRDEKYLQRDGLSTPEESLSNCVTEFTICEFHVPFDIQKRVSVPISKIAIFK